MVYCLNIQPSLLRIYRVPGYVEAYTKRIYSHQSKFFIRHKLFLHVYNHSLDIISTVSPRICKSTSINHPNWRRTKASIGRQSNSRRAATSIRKQPNSRTTATSIRRQPNSRRAATSVCKQPNLWRSASSIREQPNQCRRTALEAKIGR